MKKKRTRATTSASTTGMSCDLNKLETVLLPLAIPPVSPTILIPSINHCTLATCQLLIPNYFHLLWWALTVTKTLHISTCAHINTSNKYVNLRIMYKHYGNFKWIKLVKAFLVTGGEHRQLYESQNKLSASLLFPKAKTCISMADIKYCSHILHQTFSRPWGNHHKQRT
jgi:hypothetical protein